MKLYIKSEYVPCERQDDLYLIDEVENNIVYYELLSYNQEENAYDYVGCGEAPLEEMKQAFGVDNIELFFYHSDGSKCYYGYDYLR